MPRAKRTTDVTKMTDHELRQRSAKLEESIPHAATAGQLQQMESCIEEQVEIQRELHERAAKEAEKREAMRSAAEKAAAIRAEAQRKARIEANKAKAVREIPAKRSALEKTIISTINQLAGPLAEYGLLCEDHEATIRALAHDKRVPLNHNLPHVTRSHAENLVLDALWRSGLGRTGMKLGGKLIVQPTAASGLTLEEAQQRDADYLTPRVAALAAWEPKPEASWVDQHLERTAARKAIEQSAVDENMRAMAEDTKAKKQRDLERSHVQAVDHGGPGGSVRIVPQEQPSESV